MANTLNTSPLAQRLSTTVSNGILPNGVNTGMVATPTVATAPTAKVVTLTKFQFRQLFTMNERMLIDNIQYNATFKGSQKAAVATIVKDLDSSAEVRLGSPEVTQGIMYMVSIGLLANQRAARILANLPPL